MPVEMGIKYIEYNKVGREQVYLFPTIIILCENYKLILEQPLLYTNFPLLPRQQVS